MTERDDPRIRVGPTPIWRCCAWPARDPPFRARRSFECGRRSGPTGATTWTSGAGVVSQD